MQWKKYTLISMLLFNVCALMVFYQGPSAAQSSAIEVDPTQHEVSIWKSDIESPDHPRQEQIAQALTTLQGPLFQGPSTGRENSQTTLVVFFDYQCIHCKMMAPVLETLQNQNPTLKIVYKELPILGANSTYASKAALAAHKQDKYALVASQLIRSDDLSKNAVLNIAEKAGINMDQFRSDLNSAQIEKTLEDNLHLAKDLTIKGTPVMVVMPSRTTGHEKAAAFFVMGNTAFETLQNLIYQSQGSDFISS